MNQVTAPWPVPPEPGQHKEEPEQAMEDDIPSDDGGDTEQDAARAARRRDGEQVAREVGGA